MRNKLLIGGLLGIGAIIAIVMTAKSASSTPANADSFQPKHRYRILFTAPSNQPPTVVQAQKDLDGLFPGIFHVVDVGLNGQVAYITVDYLAPAAAPYAQYTGALGSDPNLKVLDLGVTP